MAGAGAWWFNHFVREDLTPLVQQQLSQQLKRPIQVGKLERFSLTSLRIGASALPATEKDPDLASVEAIEVQFDLWQVLWSRKLKLELTLINPVAYLEEDKLGVWVTTEFEKQKEEPPIKIEVAKVRLKNANVDLSPLPDAGQKRETIKLQGITARAEIFNNNRQFSYELEGDSATKGHFHITGETRTTEADALETNVQIQGQNFLVKEVDRLAHLPIDLPKGRADGNLTVQLRPGAKRPDLQGTATFQDVTLKLPGVPYTISKASGDLRFQDSVVLLEKSKALFGDRIPVTAKGKVDLDRGLDLTAQVPGVTIPTFLKTFAIQFPLPVTGEMSADIRLQGPLDAPVLSGSTRNTKLVVADRVPTKQVSANFRLDAKAMRLEILNVLAIPQAGGRVTGGGTIDLKQPGAIDLAFRAEGIPGDPIGRIYNNGKPMPISVGAVAANVTVTGTPTDPRTFVTWTAPQATYAAKGEVVIQGGITRLQNTVASVQGGVASINGAIEDGKLALDITTDGIALNRFSPDLRGIFSSRLRLTGALADLSPAGVRLTGETRFSEGISLITQPITAQIAWDGQKVNVQSATAPGLLAKGSVFANLDGTPQITGFDLNVQTQGLSIASLPLALPPIAKLSGQADFSGRLTGSATAPIVQGQVGVTDLVVNGIAFAPMRGSLDMATGKGLTMDLAGGADRVALRLDGAFQPLTATVRRDTLAVDARKAGGLLEGALQRIPLAELRDIGLEPAIAPISAQLGGTQLGGELSGTVALDLPRQVMQTGNLRIQQPRLGNFRGQDLVADLRGVNLAAQTIQGGKVTIVQPQLKPLFQAKELHTEFGAINLAQRSINGGTLEAIAAQVGTFKADRLALNLSPGNPTNGQRGLITASSPQLRNLQGETLSAPFFVTSNRLVLDRSVLTLPILDEQKRRIGTSQYALKGSLDWRSDPKFEGEIEVADGRIEDLLATAHISSLADLGMMFQPQANQADAKSLPTVPVGMPGAPLLQQLQRFSEINQWLTQVAGDRQNLIVPEQLDVRGQFSGKITVAGSLKTGLQAEFDLGAKNVAWYPYPTYPKVDRQGKLVQTDNRVLTADAVVLKGDFNNGIVNLRPLQIRSGDTRITLSSVQFGGEEQSGQLRIENLSVEDIQNFIPVPLSIGGQILALGGKINATVSLSGTKGNPNLIGVIGLADGTLNGNPIQSARGTFNYTDGRLNFSNTIVANSNEPLRVSGDIPIPLNLPFAQVTPSSPDIDLKVNVKDDGLALLNLLGQPISWVNGKGSVDLAVSGTLFDPKVEGQIVLENAQLRAQALPDPLTEVNGRILFNLNRVRVEDLTGKFSRGQIEAKGFLPIFRPLPDPDAAQEIVGRTGIKPLTIDLKNIAMNLKGLYRGSVNGQIRMGGSVLEPRVGGEIVLANGQILLPDAPTAVAGGGDTTSQPLELQNLKLTLGNNIRLVKAPILNFVAQGNLSVSGPLNNLQPEGRIDLLAGQVNLFTTQFVLVRGHPNRAEFRADQGLDPILDVQMIASVPEITRARIPTNSVTAEINDAPSNATNLGGLQTVRILAKVMGPASQLSENLELTSSPSRTPTEIVALLGGGFVNTLGRGDTPLGIANLAGSALLTNIQSTIGNVLGLSEFRLFPTIVNNDRNRSSTLGLAAEAGVDLFRTSNGTPVLSGTVLGILTSSNQPPQFGLLYRINDQFRLRGSTDFSGDSRLVFEFDKRF